MPHTSRATSRAAVRERGADTDATWNREAHHFAAFFQLGFTYGASVGTAAASWWEKLEGTAGNTGDINLGMAAARIGAYVASGVLPVDEVGQTIRDTICVK